MKSFLRHIHKDLRFFYFGTDMEHFNGFKRFFACKKKLLF